MLNRLQDVFASLQAHNVKYVVIGGIAAGRDKDLEDVRMLEQNE